MDINVNITGQALLDSLISKIEKLERREEILTKALGRQYLETQSLAQAYKGLQATTANLGAEADVLAAKLTKVSATTTRNTATTNSLSAANTQLSASTLAAATSQKTLHGVVRGTAGALGLLWLSYGQVIPIIGAFVAATTAIGSVKASANLQYTTKYIETLGELSGQSADGIGRMRDELLSLTAARQDVNELAIGMKEFSKAGVTVETGLKNIAEMSRFASVAEMEVAAATTLIIGQANAFGVSYSEAANMITAAATSSSTSIQEMAQAMSQTTELGSVSKVTFDEVATSLGILANAGIRGSKAGTSLRTSIMRMQTPTEKLEGMFKDLNIQWSAFSDGGKVTSVQNMFQELERVTTSLTDEHRIELMRELFGLRAIKGGANILANINKGYAEMNKHVNDSIKGVTLLEKAAASLNETTTGKWERLVAHWNNFLATASDGTAANAAIWFLDRVVDSFTAIAGAANQPLDSLRHLFGLTEAAKELKDTGPPAVQTLDEFAKKFDQVTATSKDLPESTANVTAWGAGVRAALKDVKAEINATDLLGISKLATGLDKIFLAARGSQTTQDPWMQNALYSKGQESSIKKVVEDRKAALAEAKKSADKQEAADEATLKAALRRVEQRVKASDKLAKQQKREAAAIAEFNTAMLGMRLEATPLTKYEAALQSVDLTLQEHLDTLSKVHGKDSQIYKDKVAQAASIKQFIVENDIEILKSQESVYAGLKAGMLDLAKTQQTLGEATAQAYTTSVNSMADALTEFVVTGKLNFKDFARSVIADILRIYVKQQLIGMLSSIGSAVMGAFGSGSAGANVAGMSSFNSGVISSGSASPAIMDAYANVMHVGGTVGAPGVKRPVPAAIFDTAPRLHNGLKSDEYPAILQRGEQVTAAKDVGKSEGVVINVAPNITVESGAGGSDADKESLAKTIANSVRQEVVNIIEYEKRYGGSLWAGR